LADAKKLIFFKFKKHANTNNKPATNKVVKSFDEMTDKQVDNAIAQSANTFKTEKNILSRERAVLSKVALDERENSFINFDHLRNG
jgi:acyl-CoA reductase-like NAD-dependent aldehyde dehydrogenase